MAGRLEGKVAVITGAASGIGRGAVDLFVAEGARVIAADIQDDKGARIEEDHKGRAVYIHCDVTKEGDIAAAVAAAQRHFGRLDCLFNNAGAGGARETSDGISAESFDAVMHLHVRAAMFGVKYAVPAMKAQGGGSIISTASVAGLRTGFGPFLYSVAKAAIVHMTRFAATELGPYNIRVNCLCPGLIATSIFGAGLGLPRQVADASVDAIAEGAKTAQFIPRGGLPKDIAEAALYLASDGSSFVTGHALVVDGGLTLGPSVTSQMMAFAPIVQALGLDMAALQSLTEKKD
ncbi:MAG: glucose 1-dehydrogenase [Alphaproteobacteria bacterium]|nr:glucose 1-dehydrogenase [Alphaproteobacteria bacterium]MDE2111297.1 glucose 1-dehydrogenase [Alphaproteobacteria bacterium]MDE2495873.1 glucose 1-dehydrogenase [Alphaproteobacteria bacterium]